MMEEPPEEDFCSICHFKFRIPCQANCSHWFCANCIIEVWNHGSALQPCKCPLCRRQITLLIPSEASRRQCPNAEASDILQRVDYYNRLFGERPNSLYQRLQDLPFLLRRLFRDIMDPQRSLPFVLRARFYLGFALTALYVISPVDIIPEALLGIIGLMDDFIVVLIFFLHVAALYRSFLVARHAG